MDSWPNVTICIPAYNNVNLLKKAIESIRIQNYKDYEVVISDDSQNHDVENYISSLKWDKIKYFKNKASLGSPENWNESIRLANGKYIKILHHDDWFTNESSLNEFVQLLDKNDEIDFAFCSSNVIVENGQTWVNVATQEQIDILRINPTIIFKANFIGAPSATIFRKTSQNIFFDKSLKWVVDMEFYIRTLSSNKLFAYSSSPLITTFCAEGRVSDSCANNKQVEVYEYFYLFHKMNELHLEKQMKTSECIMFLWFICRKYGIKNIREIRQVGYTNKIPLEIYILLFTYNLSNRLGSFYLKTFVQP